MPFPSTASMADIAAILVSGKSIQHKLTAAEGLTSDMIWKLVAADPVLMGDAGPVPAEGTLLPETYLFTRGTTRAELLARMAEGAAEIPGRSNGPRRAGGLPFQTPARGGDPGLDRGKGNRAAGRAPPYRRGLRQPAEGGHEAAIRSHHHLWHHQGLSAGPRHPRKARSTAATPYNTYVIDGPAAGADLQSRQGFAGRGAQSRSRATIFISSPPARAAMSFAATMAEHQQAMSRPIAPDRDRLEGQASTAGRRVTVPQPKLPRRAIAMRDRRAAALSSAPSETEHDLCQHDRLCRKRGQP